MSSSCHPMHGRSRLTCLRCWGLSLMTGRGGRWHWMSIAPVILGSALAVIHWAPSQLFGTVSGKRGRPAFPPDELSSNLVPSSETACDLALKAGSPSANGNTWIVVSKSSQQRGCVTKCTGGDGMA
jgi:hypothetical protein